MNIIEDRQVPTTLNCTDTEPIKSPKTKEKSPRRAAKLLRTFSEETSCALTRMAKSDSCLIMKGSKWKVVKNMVIFIKKSKEVVEEREQEIASVNFDIDDILTEELKQEIIEVQGSEFDLYLKGLRFRNFDNVATPM